MCSANSTEFVRLRSTLFRKACCGAACMTAPAARWKAQVGQFTSLSPMRCSTAETVHPVETACVPSTLRSQLNLGQSVWQRHTFVQHSSCQEQGDDNLQLVTQASGRRCKQGHVWQLAVWMKKKKKHGVLEGFKGSWCSASGLSGFSGS